MLIELIQQLGFNSISAILIGAITIYWIAWRNSRFVQLIEKIPGPKPLPFLGNVTDLIGDKVEFLRTVHLKWVREHGNIVRIWAANRAYVCIASPELMEPLLSSSKLITKAAEYDFLRPWLGDGTFLATGMKWRSRRRLLTPAFHFQILSSFFDVFNEQSRVLCKRLDQHCQKKPDEEIDIFPLMTSCALDIICETSMGKKIRAQEETSLYVKTVHRMGQIVMERGVQPWLAYDFVFNLTPLGRENKKKVKILHEFTEQVIRDRKAELEKEWSGQMSNNNTIESDAPKMRLAFLDLLLKAAKNGADITDTDIREEVDTVMFAGHDTTASTMTWFLYCIARHPEYQQRCIEEVDEIFGNSDRLCTTQDVAEMKYLECCIKETLRLYPSVPGIMRNITEDVTVGDYTIPAGTSVALLIYGMHHNPRVYKDPEQFKPERFLIDETSGRHPYVYIPFSAGPRNCIGQKYAMLEVKVVLSTLLRKYRFSTKTGATDMELPSSEVVLKPEGRVPLIITPR